MSQLSSYPAKGLASMSGAYGEIQVVATARDVVLDIQAKYYDVSGYLHRQTALTALPLCEAKRLRNLLDEAIGTAEGGDPRQSSVKSDATNDTTAQLVGRRRAD